MVGHSDKSFFLPLVVNRLRRLHFAAVDLFSWENKKLKFRALWSKIPSLAFQSSALWKSFSDLSKAADTRTLRQAMMVPTGRKTKPQQTHVTPAYELTSPLANIKCNIPELFLSWVEAESFQYHSAPRSYFTKAFNLQKMANNSQGLLPDRTQRSSMSLLLSCLWQRLSHKRDGRREKGRGREARPAAHWGKPSDSFRLRVRQHRRWGARGGEGKARRTETLQGKFSSHGARGEKGRKLMVPGLLFFVLPLSSSSLQTWLPQLSPLLLSP